MTDEERYQQALQQRQTEELQARLQREQDPSPMKDWADRPNFLGSGGLGVAGPSGRDRQTPEYGGIGSSITSGLGLTHEPAATPYDQLSPGQKEARDFNDFYNELPFFTRANLRAHGSLGALALQFTGKRQSLAEQLAKQAEDRRNKDEDQILGIWKDPNVPLATKKKLSLEMGRNGNPMATNLARLADEQAVAEIDQLKDYLPKGKLDGLIQTMRTPNADLAPVEMALSYARERKKATQQQQFNSERFSDLLQQHQQTPFDPSSPQFDELKTLVAERKKKDEEAQKLALDIQHLQTMNPLNAQAKQMDINRGKAPIVSAPYVTPSGEHANIITDPITGQQRLSSGVPQNTQNQRMLSPAMTKDRAEIYTGMSTLKDVAAKFSKDFVGPVDSGLNYVMRIFGHDPSRNITPGKGEAPVKVTSSEFRTSYDKLIKVLRKEAMGTAQTASETSNAPLAFPSPTDADADVTIPSFLKSGYQEYVRKMEGQDRVMDEQRRMNPVPASLRMKQLMDIAQAKDAKGKNALGYQNPKDMEEAIAERLAEEAQRGWIVIDQPVPQRR